MSYKQWLEKYYPVPADDLPKDSDDIALLNHSIRKWEGLLDLQDYGVSMIYNNVSNGANFILDIDATSCALCVFYRQENDCGQCPLARSLGRPCDDYPSQDQSDVYSRGLSNPQIMIDALNKALEMVKGERG